MCNTSPLKFCAQIFSIDDIESGSCSPAKVRRGLKVCFLVLLACLIFSSGVVMLVYYYDTTDGNALLGNSDVIPVSTINSSVDHIEITTNLNNGEMVSISVYHGMCSEIELVQSVESSSTELTVYEDGAYAIGEFYLMESSQVDYNFTVTDSQFAGLCLANVYIFRDYSDYREFSLTGIILDPSESYCLSPNKSLVVHLSSSDTERYHYVGLKSSDSARLKYTVSKDLLKYNVTRATNSSCTLKGYLFQGHVTTSVCSISLASHPQGEEVCVLASLQYANRFIGLSYTLYFFSDAILGLGFLFAFSPLIYWMYFMTMCMVCVCCMDSDSCKCCREFYFCEYLDKCPCCKFLVACCDPIDHCCEQRCTLCHECCNSEFCCDFCIANFV